MNDTVVNAFVKVIFLVPALRMGAPLASASRFVFFDILRGFVVQPPPPFQAPLLWSRPSRSLRMLRDREDLRGLSSELFHFPLTNTSLRA